MLGCCERLVAMPPPDELVAEALWTTALLSYARCFAPGARGVGLTVEDVKNTKLEGALEDWHGLLLRMRDHYADPAVDPRERFSVGVSRNSDGTPAGIAVTGLRQPLPDDGHGPADRRAGVRAAALVDERIGAQQRRVFAAAGAMSQAELDRLPEVDVDVPASRTGPAQRGRLASCLPAGPRPGPLRARRTPSGRGRRRRSRRRRARRRR